MSLADRERLVVATMGDGSYIFANPVACHQIAEALALPVLVVVVNNGEWGAVRQSVLGIYPDGHAARTQRDAADRALRRSPTSAASPRRAGRGRGGWRRGRTCPTALDAALAHVREARTLALLDVRVRP